ncbi:MULTISPECIES: endonuclease/exonuclease/phosphatase family protein [unclassified Mucilaginibacter]|uniref:endonuclease/exonuclease/phosphatase family protein n=1 Tax=unclassified Mucilaginibacter TaxID=2617802 RepID=UPI00339B92F1
MCLKHSNQIKNSGFLSGLLDRRRGRGFFNSFHAHYFFVRFPLDHAFISRHFKLNKIKRLSNYGSDHFPIFFGHPTGC